MKKLILDSLEKQRILKLHENAKKETLFEAYIQNIEENDTICDIFCEKKQAKYWAKGPVVKQIQHALANCGFNPKFEGGGMNEGCKDDSNKCDGVFKKQTELAVKEFQKKYGLVDDGVVGKKTLEKLKENCQLDFQNCECEKNTENTKKDTDDTKIKYEKKQGERKEKILKDYELNYVDCDIIFHCVSELGNTEINYDNLKICLKKLEPLVFRKSDKSDMSDWYKKFEDEKSQVYQNKNYYGK